MLQTYFFAGAAGAAGAVAVAVEVTVEVTADFVSGAEPCFWQPTIAKAATIARAAMIAEIFFILFSPFLIRCIPAKRPVAL